MKKITALALLISSVAYGQTNTFPTSGSVGVGTSAPNFKFHIRGANANSDLMTLGTTSTGNFALTSADGGAYGLFSGVSNTGKAWLQVGRYDTNTAYDLLLQGAGGNIGIGITNPQVKLDIGSTQSNGLQFRDDASTNYRIRLSPSWNSSTDTRLDFNVERIAGQGFTTVMSVGYGNNVGIGTTSPRSPLEVRVNGDNNTVQTGLIIQQTNPSSPNNSAGVSLDFGIGNNATNNNIQAKITVKETYWSVNPKMVFSLWDANPSNTMRERMVIDTNGNVGIGTSNPNQRLTVNGTIYAQEVKVDLNVPGPDYVFEEKYNLTSLIDLENYIKQNKHLPEVPSAKEMETNGINLSEMNMLLLKKVEELTLHLIEQNKINEQQKLTNEKLIKEIESLRANKN